MKVLRLWHAAVVPEYRKKLKALAASGEVRLTAVVPASWREGGRRTAYAPDPSVDAGFETVVGRVAHRDNIRRHFFLTGLFGAMRRTRPDLIDCEEEPFSAVVRQVLWMRQVLRLDAPVLFHSAHNVDRPLPRRFRSYRDRAFRECAAALVRCAEAETVLRGAGYEGPVFRTANGVDLARFRPDPSASLRNAFPFSGRRVVGYVGKLTAAKGLLTLMEAFRRGPAEWALLVVGDGPLTGELRALAGRMGFADRFAAAGAVAQADTARYYNPLDVLVLPSETQSGWKESFGRVLVEAMACGVPVIGSSSGAIPETLGGAGLVFPERDAAALASALGTVLSDEGLRARMAERGLRRARAFTWEAVARSHLDAYRCAAAGTTGRYR
jgi:glycosyltransferase involved in cell wall biosynthesis